MSTDINIKKKIAILEESTIITTDVSSIDFVGAGVTASTIGNDVTVTINAAPTGVTSIGLSMPSAFSVSNSPIISSGTIAVTGAGITSQYIRGDGTLANFPTLTGGGASVSYYLNGSVSQGTIGGNDYKEINNTPIIGIGTDFSITADGYIAQFITDIGDPNKVLIPAGNWTFETYFSASSSGGTPQFYIELYKYNGASFTLIASNSTNPENITGGTSIDLYFTTVAVPPTTLSTTDRLAVRFYVIHSGRTITMHTENSHLSQIITTFSTGLNTLNGLTSQSQYFTTGTLGTDFNISSTTDTHTFNLPTASAVNRGLLSSSNWTTFNNKVDGSGTINKLSKWAGTSTLGDSLISDNGLRTNIGGTYISNTALSIQTGINNLYGINIFASANAVSAGVITDGATCISGYSVVGVGVYGESSGSPSFGPYGINIGVQGKAFENDLPAFTSCIGGKFEAFGGAWNYSVQLIDGTESVGKFLKSVTANGHANWANITAADVSGLIDGGGTLNYVPKWTPDGTSLGDSLIYSSATTVQIGQVTTLFTPDSILRVIDDYKYSTFRVEGTSPTGPTYALSATNTQNGGFPSQHSQTATAIQAFANLSSTLNVGIESRAQGNDPLQTTNIGIWARGGVSAWNGLLGIGGKFEAFGVSKYAVQLIDGTETVAGRFLKNMTTDGKANWATLTVADTGLTLNTTGTTGAATLVGNTLSIPRHTEAVAFSPQDVSSADTAPTAASTQYYYQTISTVTGTISKVKLWGFSGTDLVRFGIYRGTLGGSMTLIGQGSATCVIGPNEISLTAEVGQTLNLVVGENLVVGYYADGTSWRTIYDVGISDAAFGITNTANITTMPATPTGTATGIRFACTLYS